VKIEKYSFGIGDRFGHQGVAQLKAFVKAEKNGLLISPVWNKSFREHEIIGSNPSDVRDEAMTAVREIGWNTNYYVDADHININNVNSFIKSSDFFTIDITSSIGKIPDEKLLRDFTNDCLQYKKELHIPGTELPYPTDKQLVLGLANKYLMAVKEASDVYSIIEGRKGKDNFIVEISIDETEKAQSPVELFFILKMIGDFNIPVQTIAPKFSGRFNKGIDYIGDTNQFAIEFEEDLLVIDFAIKKFNLPDNLKLSIHSGSDKFSIYPIISKLIKKHNKGIHVKTAGTTWLEELVGLAVSDTKSLNLVKEIYISALNRIEELTLPYSDVIDISKNRLPNANLIKTFTSEQFANAISHEPEHPEYNKDMRQLLHVSYKIAAEMGDKFTLHLKTNKETIGKHVTNNIYDRHFKRLFEDLD